MFKEKIESAEKILQDNIDVEALNKKTKELADTATDFIRKYPVQSVLGAAAIGFIIGSFLKKK
ncbi:MAG: hypothetical protein WA160_10695 [Pseudobdellovibrio sp.]